MKVKEFMRRWKEGIQKVTPFQQIKINLVGNVLVVIGVIIGLITSSMLGIWWLFIILLGSLFLTSMGLLGNIQKYFALQKIKIQMEDLNEEGTD